MTQRKLDSFAAAYGRSMKPRGMDGPIDLYLYRPIGFAIAWLLSFTKASPNQVTALSIALGLGAGLAAALGGPPAFLACAILFQLSNCLDCADGQLARLTGRHSELGRVIDGLADLAVNLAVFLGVLAGLLRSGAPAVPATIMVVAGGLAKIASCMYYDRAITRYAAAMSGAVEGAGTASELASARERAAAARGSSRLFWVIYANYVRLQEWGEAKTRREGCAPKPLALGEISKQAYSEAMLPLLSLWSFTGPSASVLYFLPFAALGRIDLFFKTCLFLALASVGLLALQQLVEQRLRAELGRERA